MRPGTEPERAVAVTPSVTAHIGRLLRYVDQAIGPLAYGRLTSIGSAFELWDLFVRFRSFV